MREGLGGEGGMSSSFLVFCFGNRISAPLGSSISSFSRGGAREKRGRARENSFFSLSNVVVVSFRKRGDSEVATG